MNHQHRVYCYDESVKCFKCGVVKHGVPAAILWYRTPRDWRILVAGQEPAFPVIRGDQ